jgi:hypothetical protein
MNRFLSLDWFTNFPNRVSATRVDGGVIGCYQQRRTVGDMIEQGPVDSFGSHEQGFAF